MYNITIVSIEGNIGSGKSTLLEYLKKIWADKKIQNKKIIFLKEPVDEWEKIKDEQGITILEKFYENQEKYSFSFQMMAYISRLKLLKDVIENKKEDESIIIITERSLYTDKMVFAKMLYDNKKIEHINYLIYLNWFDTFIKDFPLDKIIYIKATPEICLSRIIKRSRQGEGNIPLDYLKQCHEYHENMINYLDDVNKLILDGDIDIYESYDKLQKYTSIIIKFISK